MRGVNPVGQGLSLGILTVLTALTVLAGWGCSEGGGKDRPRLAEASDQARLDLLKEYRGDAIGNPENPKVWFRWGVVLLELGLPDGAGVRFMKAVNLEPRDFLAREFLGHSLYAAGRFGEAYETYRKLASDGVDMRGILERSRHRIGDLVGPRGQSPGLAGVVELIAPDVRKHAVDAAAEFERLGARSTVTLRAVDRVLIGRYAVSGADSGAPARVSFVGVPEDFLQDYLKETFRLLTFDRTDLARRWSGEPSAVLAEVVAISGAGLEGLRTGGASEDELFGLLNEALGATEIRSRYFVRPSEDDAELTVIFVTSDQFDRLDRGPHLGH